MVVSDDMQECKELKKNNLLLQVSLVIVLFLYTGLNICLMSPALVANRVFRNQDQSE